MGQKIERDRMRIDFAGAVAAGVADPGFDDESSLGAAALICRLNSSTPRAPLPETAWKLVANTRRTPKTR